MKKSLFLFLILCLVVFFSGCLVSKNVVIFQNEDGSLYNQFEVSKKDMVTVDDPIKEGYTFVGWYNGEEKVTLPSTFEEDIILKAKFEINIYDYYFYVDGEVYSSGSLEYGSEIPYPKNPTKETKDGIKYKFLRWDNDCEVLTKEEKFNAIFEDEKLKYTCTFLDGNGEVIKEDVLEHGTTIIYPETAAKDSTQQYSFEFVGWDIDDEVITSDIFVSPIFKEVLNKYTYKFIDDAGNVIKEELVDYGTVPTEPNAPVKEGYEFVGWDKEISAVEGNVEYTAIFSEIITSLEGKKLSILGDSISTFYAEGSEMNSYYSGTNQFYYPLYSSTVKTVDKTWWYQLLKNTNMELGINNSWSGSCAYGTGSSAGCSDDRINTIDDNGTPDIVIIYLGTNDCASGFSTENFIEAVQQMITKVRKLGVSNIFITTLGYSAYKGSSYKEETRLSYNEELRKLANANKCGIVPLDNYITDLSYSFYLGDNLHYNAKGAELLSKIYEKSIKEHFDLEYTGEIEVEEKMPLPAGVVGKITVTSNTNNFWGLYDSNVFFVDSSFTNPQYSYRIQLKYDSTNNYYVVSSILKSGDVTSLDGDYIIIISDAHVDNKAILADIEKVVVGSIAEFDPTSAFPFDIIFK